jgi:hypothetical protein
MVKRTTTSNKKKWLIGTLAVFGVLVIGLIGFISWAFGYEGSTNEIVAVADQFKVDPSWKQTENDIQPKKFFCGDISCPRVLRSWQSDGSLSRDQLSALLTNSGWEFKIENDCIQKPNDYSVRATVCSAEGVVSGYRVSVSVSKSNPPKDFIIQIDVEENH